MTRTGTLGTRHAEGGGSNVPVGEGTWAWVGLTLLVLWLATAAVTVVLYEHAPTPEDLSAAVAAGRADDVRVTGGLPPGATGWATQELRWREGWQRHQAQVVVGASGPQVSVGTHVPSGLGVVILALVAASMMLTGWGPQPWRATRWAWFWLCSVPFVAIAWVLLAGPAPLVPRPDPTRRRLAGGWAFLLALVLVQLFPMW